jgi:hypothetical protein
MRTFQPGSCGAENCVSQSSVTVTEYLRRTT